MNNAALADASAEAFEWRLWVSEFNTHASSSDTFQSPRKCICSTES